jgi:hypothetical protein
MNLHKSSLSSSQRASLRDKAAKLGAGIALTAAGLMNQWAVAQTAPGISTDPKLAVESTITASQQADTIRASLMTAKPTISDESFSYETKLRNQSIPAETDISIFTYTRKTDGTITMDMTDFLALTATTPENIAKLTASKKKIFERFWTEQFWKRWIYLYCTADCQKALNALLGRDIVIDDTLGNRSANTLTLSPIDLNRTSELQKVVSEAEKNEADSRQAEINSLNQKNAEIRSDNAIDMAIVGWLAGTAGILGGGVVWWLGRGRKNKQAPSTSIDLSELPEEQAESIIALRNKLAELWSSAQIVESPIPNENGLLTLRLKGKIMKKWGLMGRVSPRDGNLEMKVNTEGKYALFTDNRGLKSNGMYAAKLGSADIISKLVFFSELYNLADKETPVGKDPLMADSFFGSTTIPVPPAGRAPMTAAEQQAQSVQVVNTIDTVQSAVNVKQKAIDIQTMIDLGWVQKIAYTYVGGVSQAKIDILDFINHGGTPENEKMIAQQMLAEVQDYEKNRANIDSPENTQPLPTMETVEAQFIDYTRSADMNSISADKYAELVIESIWMIDASLTHTDWARALEIFERIAQDVTANKVILRGQTIVDFDQIMTRLKSINAAQKATETPKAETVSVADVDTEWAPENTETMSASDLRLSKLADLIGWTETAWDIKWSALLETLQIMGSDLSISNADNIVPYIVYLSQWLHTGDIALSDEDMRTYGQILRSLISNTWAQKEMNDDQKKSVQDAWDSWNSSQTDK